MSPSVLAVHAAHRRPERGFAKPTRDHVTMTAGAGVDDDVHAGTRDLRQVHLIDVRSYDLLRGHGRDLGPGHLGENVTTEGADLLDEPEGTLVHLGEHVVLRLTGVRFPRHEDPATDPDDLDLDADGVPVGRVGVFAVVVTGGRVAAGDEVRLVPPPSPGGPLRPL